MGEVRVSLAFLLGCLGSRMMCAGLTGFTSPMTIQAKSIRGGYRGCGQVRTAAENTAKIIPFETAETQANKGDTLPKGHLEQRLKDIENRKPDQRTLPGLKSCGFK